MTSKTVSTTVYEVTVPGGEYNRIRKGSILFYVTAAALIFSCLLALGTRDWLGLGLMFTFLVILVIVGHWNHSKRHRLLLANGWDGLSYPIKVVPEYQSFIHD